MGYREIPKIWSDGDDKFKPGSNFRKSLAATWWNETLASVASEVSDPEGTGKKATSDQIDGWYIGDGKESSLQGQAYTYMYGRYHAILGDGAVSKLDPNVTYLAMDLATLRKNFGTPGGVGMDSYVASSAGELKGYIFQMKSAATAGAAPARPNYARSQAEVDAEAAKFKKAMDMFATSGSSVPIAGASGTSVADFKEQCFMLAHIFKFVDYKMNNVELVERKRLPYSTGGGSSSDGKVKNACLMIDSEPYGFMNKLTQYSSQSTLLNLQTSEVSSLVPQIRLFKVYENDEGEEISQEFHFDSAPTKNSIEFALSDRRKRGVGAGINDFTFSYEGTNPFGVKKSIKASLTLFAASFDELFRPRNNLQDKLYRYVDLALKTGGPNLANKLDATKGTVEYENLTRLNFRIKAVVGWQTPKGKTGAASSDLTKAVNNSFVTLNLTPTIHKFDIADDGSVRFNVQYLAYIESHFDNKMFSVFGTESSFKNSLIRKLTESSLSQNCQPKEMAAIKDKFQKEAKDDIRNIASSIITSLTKKRLLRYVNIPYSKLRSLNMEGPYSDFGKDFNTKATAPDPAIKKKIDGLLSTGKALSTRDRAAALNRGAFSTRPSMGGSVGKYSCAFFYVSDLIDTIIEGIDDRLESADSILSEIEKDAGLMMLIDDELLHEEKLAYINQKNAFKKMRVLLGPLEIVNQQDPTVSKFINMGDIPVSVKYFTQWLAKNTMNRATVIYPLPRFLDQFFKNFVATFLNDDTCFEGAVKQRTLLTQAVVTSYKKKISDDSDVITTAIDKMRIALKSTILSRLPASKWPAYTGNPSDPWPILNISGVSNTPISDAGAESEINYLTYFAGRANPAEKQNGDYNEDKENGIHHYVIGKDRGIVKKIRMTATNIPFLKEVRFAQEGYNGLEQLREVYDVNIDSYANVGVFPGTYIYVDPRGWSPTTGVANEKELKQMHADKIITAETLASVLENDLTRFGIGGYYMVKRSEHSFGPGKANTVIQAQWVMSSNDNSGNSSKPAAINKPSKSKCQVKGSDTTSAPESTRSAEITSYVESVEAVATTKSWADAGAIDVS